MLEVALQFAFQEKCSYTMAVRGLLGEGSVTVANEMGRRSVSVAVAAAFALLCVCTRELTQRQRLAVDAPNFLWAIKPLQVY